MRTAVIAFVALRLCLFLLHFVRSQLGSRDDDVSSIWARAFPLHLPKYLMRPASQQARAEGRRRCTYA